MISSISSLKPQLQLISSRLISSLRPSLISFLAANGARLSNGAENPISFCNVLFVGNFCAALLVGCLFGFKKIIKDFFDLETKLKVGLFLNASLSALLSALIFSGLEYTTITNTVLLGRLSPLFAAIAGSLVFGRRMSKAEYFGYSLIFFSVVSIILKINMYHLNRGDWLILASTVVYTIISVLDQLMLSKELSVKLIIFNRNCISSIIFFIIANYLFGFSHFMDAFSGQLWILMIIYALLAIVTEQFLWYSSVEKLNPSVVNFWASLTPLASIFYAFILNGERPQLIQLIALILTCIGFLIAHSGKSQQRQPVMMMQTENMVSVN